jgi:hypothetical protein
MRAAVVFTHSALETALREVVGLKMKHDGIVSWVPLAGQSGFPSRNRKFTLKELAKHRGKTVDKLLIESIDEYLDVLSFNSSDDIADMLTRVKLPQSTLRQYYPGLEEMISRRHQIVHEADLARGHESSQLRTIDPEQVGTWIDITADFCAEAIRLVIEAVHTDRILERCKEEGIEVSKQQIGEWITVGVEDKYERA